MTPRTNLRAVPARRIGTPLAVAIADEMPLFREGLSVRVLRDPGMRLVGVTGRPAAGVLLRDRLAVDVLVLDAVLDPHGHLARRLIAANTGMTVVVLVREPYRTTRFVAAMRAAGVHGLVEHSSPPDRIMDAIRRSRAEGRYVDPALTGLAATTIGTAATTGTAAGRPLSRREAEVLRLIADGLANQAIADALTVSVETVRTHIKSLLRKLSARDRAHAVAVGFRIGLLTPPDVDVVIPVARGGSRGAGAPVC
jgi:DNA-binding NarL/FixJ family response regulator